MKFISLIFTAMLSASGAIAGPGAHGPNGEHLDAPAGHVHNGGGPRVETFTETFELVAHLEADELSILVDRLLCPANMRWSSRLPRAKTVICWKARLRSEMTTPILTV
ncbi:MAG: hypothetical protein K0S28_2561 [Paucimonas sp.]|nr:hypothetical protein [Paucimonas sp.]